MTPQAAFEQLNRIAGLAPFGAPVFTGEEAQLSTPLRAATAAAASLGLAGAIAAELWRFRGGERQSVSLDLKAAAASLLSQSFVRRNGAPPTVPAGPTTGFYQCADQRWIHLHGGSPRLARRTLELLNAANDAKSVLEGVAKWNGFALEEALAYMQLCGAVARSQEEWRASMPGRALGAPIALKKIGEAAPLRLVKAQTPLTGVRVLDLTRALAGPACGQLLASHGAEVLAIRAERLDDGLDAQMSAGKRLSHLDLVKPADAETLRRLARGAHIFLESFRPGAMDKLGFSPAALAYIAPGMIHVSISAYGAAGPWASRRGFEQSVETATGIALEQGGFLAQRRKQRRESLPELLPGAVLDYVTGSLAAAGALAALLRRIREGGSWQVEVSLAATASWLMSLGRIEPRAVPDGFEAGTGLDQYLRSCETEGGVLEFLGPVVRMSKTPPLLGAPPSRAEAPRWVSAREDVHAAQAQSA